MRPQSATIDNIFSGLRSLHPNVRKTRLVNWALLIWGLLRARSAAVPDIAAQLPLPIQAGSREKRLIRWLDNLAVCVADFFAPVACCVLETLAATSGSLRLLVDRVEVKGRLNLLIVCVAFRSRAFPLFWYELGHAGASTQKEQIALLKRIKPWIPPETLVFVIADREFRGMNLACWIRRQSWHYVLRLKCDTKINLGDGNWQRLDSLGLKRGERRFLRNVHVALSNPFGPTHLALVWARSSKEPWYLLTDLEDLEEAVRLYRVRMWCEQLWRDFKSQGFDLEASHIEVGERLERLLLGIALATVWALWTGAKVVRRHLRRRVDSGRRRRLSLFLIGIRWLEHCLALFQHLTLLLPPDPMEVTI